MHRQSSRTRPSGTHRALSAIVLTAVILAAVDTRATDGSGDSISSQAPGTTNRAPSFGATTTTRSVAENTAADHDIGAPVTATDPDSGETLTYRLEGTDAAAFDIVSTSGQLRTTAALDHEAQSIYSVTVAVQDGQGATDTIAVAITVTDENEPPLAPGAPKVGRVVGSHTSLAVRWTAPDNTGRPAIESYDVQYRTLREPW